MKQVVGGPVEDVALLDATWQGSPEWTDETGWVTVHAPDLFYEGPPYPGLLVRANVPLGGDLRISVVETTPGSPLERVFETELIVGDHGFVIETDGGHIPLPMLAGNYSVEVWVDAADGRSARSVSFVFGERRPRELGPPRPTIRW